LGYHIGVVVCLELREGDLEYRIVAEEQDLDCQIGVAVY
jgi:hypothetical protein